VTAAALLAALALAAEPIGFAPRYDPAFHWRTIETPRFRVHYHQGEEELAQEVVRQAERAHAILSPLLRYAPRQRTEVVLSDDTDDANGSATPLPYNTIRLYAVAPSSLSELNDYRDWLASLVFHEYTHILHLDDIGGAPAVLNAVFGKILVPNGLTPSFMIEGLAVLHEGDGEPPGSGRLASALHDMEARALVMEGGPPRLDQVANPLPEWPVGDFPYLLGSRFMRFLQERYGDERIAGFEVEQGTQLWPYAPGLTAERWFGKDLLALWADFAQEERAGAARALEAIRARPVTHPLRLTRDGGQAGRPRWSPDGSYLAYYRQDLDRRPGIFRVAPDGRPLGQVVTVDLDGALALRSPQEAVVAMGEVWHEFRVYGDLWKVDVRSGARRRLTDGARATDPDLGPDGRTLVYVRRTGGGSMALVRRPIDGGEEEVLFARGGAQVFAPAVSPDGRRIAFELHADGRRDIALWEDGRVTRVTDDDALDTSPAWTPDGRFLLFDSDRGGVYNLYAWEAARGAVRQVTNVETGALAPQVSPDGKTIAFLTYTRAGYDLATVPFDPASWLDPTPALPPVAFAPLPPAEPLPSHDFRVGQTLGPTFWLPLLGGDGAGTTFGALASGGDVLGLHAYVLEAWWSEAHQPGYAVGYRGGWSWPRLDLSSSRFIDTADAGRGLEAVWTPLDAGLTFTVTRLASSLAVRLGWAGTIYDVLGVTAKATGPEELRIADGFLSEASLVASWTDARRFVRSISPEEGRTAALELDAGGRWTGSDFQLARARGSVAQYLRVPWTDHAVLALRAAGGVADGSIGGRAPFTLGGSPPPDPLGLILGTTGLPPDSLRGYPSDWLEGTGYVLGNLEVRFPIAVPVRGWSTWPIFLRRIHGAVFADLGEAFDRPGQLPFAGYPLTGDQLRLGAGAELRLELVLGYYIRTDLRLGIAHAFGRVFAGQTSEPGVGPVTVYLGLGEAF